MSNLVQWEEWTDEDAAEDKKRLDSGKAFFKPKEGRNILRFLPGVEGKPFRIYYQHFLTFNDKKISFVCPAKVAEEGLKPSACPACAHAEKIMQTQGKDAAKGWWSRKRVVANVIDRRAPERGPLRWDMPQSVYSDLLEIKENSGNFTDVKDGFDICVTRVGTGLDTEYKVNASRKNSPAAEDEETLEEWAGNLVDLNAVCLPMSEDEIRAQIMGEAPSKAKAALPAAEDDDFSELDEEDELDF